MLAWGLEQASLSHTTVGPFIHCSSSLAVSSGFFSGPLNVYLSLSLLISGGHTSEMLKLTSGLSPQTYSPLWYVVASTDHTSADRIPKEGLRSGRCKLCMIPRSREVSAWCSTHAWCIRKCRRGDDVYPVVQVGDDSLFDRQEGLIQQHQHQLLKKRCQLLACSKKRLSKHAAQASQLVKR